MIGYISLGFLLLVSFIFNIYFVTSSNQCQTKAIVEEQRMMSIPPKDTRPIYNGTQVVECKREFFLFHQDQNHVCEVVNIIIKNDTKIIGKNNVNF